MNANLLIDAVVRQTTVLIAQLAASAGFRAPLAHTANQVFLNLVSELKDQGLGNKVIADMFGLALSTYHDKVRRFTESQSYRGRSLWEAVLSFIQEQDALLQTDVLNRFRHDNEALVRAVLNDLVESGFVLRSGRAHRTTLRAARPEEISLAVHDGKGALASLVWLAVHRRGPLSFAEVVQSVQAEATDIVAALEGLIAEQRVAKQGDGESARYSATDCVIPVGDSAGWEAAVFDHYQAVVTAICTKLQLGQRRAELGESIGGSTYGFTIWRGHPHYDEVMGFLTKMRAEGALLRQKVHDYNQTQPVRDHEGIGVIAYVGQTVLEPSSSEDGS